MYFGHLLFKQTLYQLRMCSGNKNLRALCSLLYLQYIYLDAIHKVILFAGNLFVCGKNRINLAHLHDNISAFLSLYDGSYNLSFLCNVLVKENFSFCLAEFLYHHLLCGLCGNSAEVLRCYLQIHHIANHIVGVQHSCHFQRDFQLRIFHRACNGFLRIAGNIAGFSVDNHLNILACAEVFLACRNQGCLDCLKYNFLINTLLLCNQIQRIQKFFTVHFPNSSLSLKNNCQSRWRYPSVQISLRFRFPPRWKAHHSPDPAACPDTACCRPAPYTASHQ